MTFLFLSMTSRADENDKWAAHAGPGGWNGKKIMQPSSIFFVNLRLCLVPENLRENARERKYKRKVEGKKK